MAFLQWFKKTQAEIDAIPIQEGNIFFNKTNKEITVDDDGVRTHYGGSITIDSALSDTSTNPVQNQVITNELDLKAYESDLQTVSHNISDEYSSSSTYAIDDYCIYQNVLYKCNTAISTPESWNASHWTQTVVTNELGSGGGESGTVLWTNPSPASDFPAQTITLSEDISNYNYYVVEYRYSTGSTIYLSTNKISTLNATRIKIPTNKFNLRDIIAPVGTTISFYDAFIYTTYSGTTTSVVNSTVIPTRILGYKNK